MESGMYDRMVAVAVKKGKYSQLALKWAVENLAKDSQTMIWLVHVRPKVHAFKRDLIRVSYQYRQFTTQYGEEIAKELEQSFTETLNLQVKEMFSPLSSYCKRKKVQYQEVIVEEIDPVRGISDFVLKFNIDVLVIGSGLRGRGGVLRKIMGLEIATKTGKTVPCFCTVYTIGKGGAMSVKSASTSAQAPPPLTSGGHCKGVDHFFRNYMYKLPHLHKLCHHLHLVKSKTQKHVKIWSHKFPSRASIFSTCSRIPAET